MLFDYVNNQQLQIMIFDMRSKMYRRKPLLFRSALAEIFKMLKQIVLLVADPRGCPRHPRRPPPPPPTDQHFLNFMQFFGGDLAILYVGAPS